MREFKEEGILIRQCDMFGDDGVLSLPDDSVDAVITDLPYGLVNKRGGSNHWDSLIDLPSFWEVLKRVRTDMAPVISTASQPFTSILIHSNLSEFRYNWVWEKSKASGYMNARKQPLKAHEDVVVFYRKHGTYNPQMTEGKPYDKGTAVRDTPVYGLQTKAVHVHNDKGLRYPRTVQYFVTAEKEGKYHPTQKPIALFEYLIKTYTNEGDLILDPCMGGGTTALACLRTNRRFVGFEIDPVFYDGAEKRIIEKIHEKTLSKRQKVS